jgi:sigma-B regulation protein RsbU (phosphoserine phosphatase)
VAQDLAELIRDRERLVEELRTALRGSERRFDAIVGSLTDPVTIRDREHRFLYANRAALAYLGFESWEQLRATAPATIMSDYLVRDDRGEEVAMDDIPSVRLLRGEAAEPLLIQTIQHDTGAQRWNLLKAAPLLDEHGEVDATIMIIEDVTEQRRAELRNAFLADASAALASSLDYEQTLRNVAELAVPGIADAPEQLPAIPGYDLGSIYLPAVETSMVGGDFYDIWEVQGRWLIVIGDVTGKGIEAAALTALVRHTLRAAAEFQGSPAELLAFVDATLKKRPGLSVCTALCVALEGDTAAIAVGGHPLPLYITGDGVREVGEHGPLLGAFPAARWQDSTLALEAGSTLLAYTDGITDARDGDQERFGFERLRDTLAQLAERPAAEVIDELVRRLEEFQIGTHTDDTAAIAVHRSADGATLGGRETHAVLRTGTITTPA